MQFLCAGLIAFAVPAPAAADDAPAATAILLTARAKLPDPNFSSSVVLVMNNLGPVPGGVIINRPTRMTVSHLFPDVENLAGRNDKVYYGGPVAMGSVSFLFRADRAPPHTVRVVDGVYVSTDATLLRRLLGREKPMEGLRIFIGYSGWAPGQLENEIARGDWTLAPADADAIFEPGQERPWPDRGVADDARRI